MISFSHKEIDLIGKELKCFINVANIIIIKYY